MLTPISNSAITHCLAAQKTVKPSFLSLPLEIQGEIESRLDFSSQQTLFKALTTATRNGEPIEVPALKLHLIKERVQAKYQGALMGSDEELRKFALSQLQKLSDSGQLDQVVEKLALFELVCLVNDPEIFKFLRERVQQDAQLKEKLLDWVERSKTEEVQLVATNALTTLVKAGVQLNNQDFSGICVPGADLSYGVFDSTQFQGADLAGVDFGEKPSLEMEDTVQACCYSPDGRWLAVTEGNAIHLYETKHFQRIHSYTGHTAWVTSVAYSSDGQWIASGSGDRTVKLWHVAGERVLTHSYTGHEGSVMSVAFSNDGQWLASGGEDQTVKLWQVGGERTLAHVYTGHTDYVMSVAFSSDGQWLASGSGVDQLFVPGSVDNTVKLWHVTGERALAHTYIGHTDYVMSVTFSSDGQWIASGSDDQTVRLWQVGGERALAHTYAGHTDAVRSVAFSSDGQWLASGSEDQTVRLWSVLTGDCQTVLEGWIGSIRTVAWRPMQDEAAMLATAGDDKTIRLWQVPYHSGKIGTITLDWASRQDVLTASGAFIQNARNLSPQNTALLRQRGAI
ncbi:WD40 repeat domain-containing protein [Mycoavidus sp. SF9855]|uniref:WD40 repeat domain-containing protein n=1 Tax=Mycoavidus sp. SF9855 TaxID=2968475 RepID=UPI00211C4309|nr:WD40 repeat domain-containing protein [Mycoavidus sp. SF9855]UUM20903.1 hypothetical protein NQD60_05320 [Mycoavidus sp. SF9855]